MVPEVHAAPQRHAWDSRGVTRGASLVWSYLVPEKRATNISFSISGGVWEKLEGADRKKKCGQCLGQLATRSHS